MGGDELRLRPSIRPDGDVALFVSARAGLGGTQADRRFYEPPTPFGHLIVAGLVVFAVAITGVLTMTRASAAPTFLPVQRATTSAEPDAAAIVHVVGGAASQRGRLLLATVPLSRMRHGSQAAVAHKLRRDGPRLMRDAATHATAAAQQCVGRRIDVRLDAGRVVGSSGGLMLALAIVDQATPGDLTRGIRVAGTGAIDRNGKVRPVLEVAQKAQIAERARAELFLVPASQAHTARPFVRKTRIVPVRTLNDALAALRAPRCIP